MDADKHSRRSEGQRWRTAGFTLFFIAPIGFFAITYYFAADGTSDLGFRIAVPVAGGIATAAIACMRRGKRMLALTAGEILASDTREPVLYLRSFATDVDTSRWSFNRGIVNYFDLSLAAFTRLRFETEEESIARVMSRIGPFVGMGAPSEELPEVGAARLYSSEQDWQQLVSSLMGRAQLIVFRTDEGEPESDGLPFLGLSSPEPLTLLSLNSQKGFWWEVEKAVQVSKPERLLFLLGFSGEIDYAGFRNNLEKYLPCRLPELPLKPRFSVYSQVGIKAILYFDPNWTPHMARVKGRKHGTYLVAELEKLMKPVADNLGIGWRPPRRFIRGIGDILVLWLVCSVLCFAVLICVALLRTN